MKSPKSSAFIDVENSALPSKLVVDSLNGQIIKAQINQFDQENGLDLNQQRLGSPTMSAYEFALSQTE